MKSKIFTTILLIISLNTLAQKWEEVTKDKFGNKYYIKTSYVSKGGQFGSDENIIKIWTKKTVNEIEDKRQNKRKIYKNAYVIELIEFDCRNSSTKLHSRTAYSAQGNLIIADNIDPFDTDWNVIIPDSVGETIINRVCELYN